MGKLIIDDIWSAAEEYMPLAVVTGIIILSLSCILYIVYNIVIHKEEVMGIRPGKVILLYTLYVYIFMIISITLLSREPGSRIRVNLRLFSTITNDIYGNSYVVENIMLFLPLGFILPLLNNKFSTCRACLIIGFLCSFFIEGIQYLTQRGYFQTDDIIMNVVGTGLGFILLKIILQIKNLFD